LPARFCPSGQFGETHAHCTHLQIAQANPQTEICKRVQSSTPQVGAYE